MLSFLKDIKATRVENAAAAGTSDLESDIIDMQGFEGVAFVVLFGTITANAVTSVKVQQDTDSAGGTMADLEGTGYTVADSDDNKAVIVEVYRPLERYIRCVVDRGTQNAVVDGIVAFQYGAAKLPVTQDATTVEGELTVSPAQGTA